MGDEEYDDSCCEPTEDVGAGVVSVTYTESYTESFSESDSGSYSGSGSQDEGYVDDSSSDESCAEGGSTDEGYAEEDTAAESGVDVDDSPGYSAPFSVAEVEPVGYGPTGADSEVWTAPVAAEPVAAEPVVAAPVVAAPVVAAPVVAQYAPQPQVVDVDATGAPTHVRFTQPIPTNDVTMVEMGGNQTAYTGVPDPEHVVSAAPPAPASTAFYGTTVGGQVRTPSADDYGVPGSVGAGGGLGIVDASNRTGDMMSSWITGVTNNRDSDGNIESYTTTDGADFKDRVAAQDYEDQYDSGVKDPYAGPELDR